MNIFHFTYHSDKRLTCIIIIIRIDIIKTHGLVPVVKQDVEVYKSTNIDSFLLSLAKIL